MKNCYLLLSRTGITFSEMSGVPRDWKIQILMGAVSKRIIVIFANNYSVDCCYKSEPQILLMLISDFHANKYKWFWDVFPEVDVAESTRWSPQLLAYTSVATLKPRGQVRAGLSPQIYHGETGNNTAQQSQKAYPLSNEAISKGSNKQYSFTCRCTFWLKMAWVFW